MKKTKKMTQKRIWQRVRAESCRKKGKSLLSNVPIRNIMNV